MIKLLSLLENCGQNLSFVDVLGSGYDKVVIFLQNRIRMIKDLSRVKVGEMERETRDEDGNRTGDEGLWGFDFRLESKL